MSRALRRHHRQRLMAKRRQYHTAHGFWTNRPETVARYVDTPCPCSCAGCGNPRRSVMAWSERLTMQERRFAAEEE